MLVLEPAVEGAATFVSPRELVFAPAADLPSGQEYRATLVREGLLGLPDDLGDYRFDFSVVHQRLEILVDGLETESGEEDDLVLTGSIVTADFAEAGGRGGRSQRRAGRGRTWRFGGSMTRTAWIIASPFRA